MAAVHRAIARDLNDDEAYLALSYQLDGLRRFAKSFDASRRATEFGPGDFENWKSLAFSASSIGDMESAESAMHRVIAIAPDDPETWGFAAGIAVKLDKPETVHLVADGLIRTDGDSCDTWSTIAWMALFQRYVATIERCLERINTMDGKSKAKAYTLCRGYLAAYHHDWQTARTQFHVAVTDKDERPNCSILCSWATACAHCGDWDTAQKVLHRAKLDFITTKRCLDQSCPDGHKLEMLAQARAQG